MKAGRTNLRIRTRPANGRRSMHILHISDIPFQDGAGGSRKYAHETAREMAASGHRVSFLAGKTHDSLPDFQETDGYRLIRYGCENAVSQLRQARRAFERLHRADPVDAVFIHFAYSALPYIFHRERRNIPTVTIFHGPWHQEAALERPRNSVRNKLLLHAMFRIERAVLDRSDRVITLSQFMADTALEAFGLSGDKISVIPGGVDPDVFSPGDKKSARRRLGIPDDRFIAFTVRRLSRRMGLEDLIDAAGLINGDVPGLQILIAGKGELTEELNERIRERGVGGRVRLTGFVSDEQLPDYYRAADCFLLPTVALEGFGLVILEALSCNTPVFGTPVGAIPDVLDLFGPDMTLPDTGAHAIAEKLKEFAATRSRKAGDYRSIITKNYTWKHVAEKMLIEIR